MTYQRSSVTPRSPRSDDLRGSPWALRSWAARSRTLRLQTPGLRGVTALALAIATASTGSAPAFAASSAGRGLSTATVAEVTGAVEIRNECSGKLLTVAGSSIDDGAGVQIRADADAPAQRFEITDAGNGYSTMTAVHSGKALDIAAEGTEDGTPAIQWRPHGDPNQRWQLTDVGAGLHRISPEHAPGSALDVSGAGTGDGTRVQLWTDNGTCAQRWTIVPVDGQAEEPGDGPVEEPGGPIEEPGGEPGDEPVEEPGMQPGAGVAAARSADFFDSLGVSVGVGNWITRFDSVDKPALLELGVEQVRVGINVAADRREDEIDFQRCRALAEEGIRITLLASALPTTWNGQTASDPSMIDEAFDWCGGRLEAVEGVNEPNLQNVPDWAARTRADQKALFEAVQSTPRMADVDVLGPSPVMGEANEELGDLSAYMDYGNMHAYYGNRPPENSGWGSEFYGFNYGAFGYQTGYAAVVSGDKPIMTTETGYSTKVDQATGRLTITDAVKAKYLLRTYLHQFANGIPRTFAHTLVNGTDDPYDIEGHFGLVEDDGTRTASFYALKNLATLVEDDGARTAPAALDFAIGGQTDQVEQLLLQKSDGTFLLALWNSAQGWNPDTFEEVPVAAQQVRVDLPSSIGTALVHEFNDDGSLASAPGTAADLTVDVTDRVTVLELTP